MLPPLDAIICPDREYKDGPAAKGPGRTVNLHVTDILYEILKAGSSGLDMESFKHWCDV